MRCGCWCGAGVLWLFAGVATFFQKDYFKCDRKQWNKNIHLAEYIRTPCSRWFCGEGERIGTEWYVIWRIPHTLCIYLHTKSMWIHAKIMHAARRRGRRGRKTNGRVVISSFFLFMTNNKQNTCNLIISPPYLLVYFSTPVWFFRSTPPVLLPVNPTAISNDCRYLNFKSIFLFTT